MDNILVHLMFKTILCLGIPFVWWLATARKTSPFFVWVGLYKTDKPLYHKFGLTFVLALVFIFLMLTFYYLVHPAFLDTPIYSGYIGTLQNLYFLFVFPVFTTGFLEEVGFRGFLGKRLIGKFGFAVGNTLQAVVFGLVHNIHGIFAIYGITAAVGVFAITGGFGWIAGYLTEKQAGGSIRPAWLLHALANFSIFQLFGLMFLDGVVRA